MKTWRMSIACWIPKCINIHSQYVILVVLPLQQWLHERVSVLSYTYMAWLVGTSHYIWTTSLNLPGTMNEIWYEVKQTSFMPMTQRKVVDVYEKCQLWSVSFYANPDGSVKERGMKFSDVSEDRSAASFYVDVLNLTNEYQCEEKLAAQTRWSSIYGRIICNFSYTVTLTSRHMLRRPSV